jgi:hypothetical protein
MSGQSRSGGDGGNAVVEIGEIAVPAGRRVDHNHGDPHRFDADKDEWGCEIYG